MVGALKEVSHWLEQIGHLPADLLTAECFTQSDFAGCTTTTTFSSTLMAQEILSQSDAQCTSRQL